MDQMKYHLKTIYLRKKKNRGKDRETDRKKDKKQNKMIKTFKILEREETEREQKRRRRKKYYKEHEKTLEKETQYEIVEKENTRLE